MPIERSQAIGFCFYGSKRLGVIELTLAGDDELGVILLVSFKDEESGMIQRIMELLSQNADCKIISTLPQDKALTFDEITIRIRLW